MTKTNENTRYQNVKFNDYPDVKDITKPYVVLDDFDDPIPEVHYDGERSV